MIKSLRLEKVKTDIEDKVIKDVRDLFRQKKEIDDNTITDIKYLFWLK